MARTTVSRYNSHSKSHGSTRKDGAGDASLSTQPTKAPQADFLFQNHGSICLLQPLTPSGRTWFNENLPVDNPETQFVGDSIVIEPRYASDILQGIHSDGLRVGVA